MKCGLVDFVRQRSRCVRLLEETCHGTTVKTFLRNFFREAAAQDDFHARVLSFQYGNQFIPAQYATGPCAPNRLWRAYH